MIVVMSLSSSKINVFIETINSMGNAHENDNLYPTKQEIEEELLTMRIAFILIGTTYIFGILFIILRILCGVV